MLKTAQMAAIWALKDSKQTAISFRLSLSSLHLTFSRMTYR